MEYSQIIDFQEAITWKSNFRVTLSRSEIVFTWKSTSYNRDKLINETDLETAYQINYRLEIPIKKKDLFAYLTFELADEYKPNNETFSLEIFSEFSSPKFRVSREDLAELSSEIWGLSQNDVFSEVVKQIEVKYKHLIFYTPYNPYIEDSPSLGFHFA